jgi:hypothetical protein
LWSANASVRRFADTGLAGQQHHLPFACLCLRPAPQQKIEFFLPPDKLGLNRLGATL